jgi:hypothetical protein
VNAIELEGPMMKRMTESEETVGVYLLPRGIKVKMHRLYLAAPVNSDKCRGNRFGIEDYGLRTTTIMESVV